MRSGSCTGQSLPELLAPAGSPEALEAAFCAGADAVYLGGTEFNARMNAHNFSPDELEAAVSYAHARGGRVYLTLNTLIYDRELPDALRAAYGAARAGVDGLIIADLGAAACIHRALPGLALHASTQLSGHNAAMGQALAAHGFSRFVIARETRLCDLASAVADNPLEVEVFVHGALCVCHSGQCLFSSLVGGRSGNRGECAQPCRLPYRDARGREAYPLSLKDLSLAAHIPALIQAGVSSLKIEGRMKSPAYVGGVVSIFRRLLDEARPASPDEQAELAALFSRGGFTDGYLTGRIDHRMNGVRSEQDKARSAAAEKRVSAALNPARAPGRLPLEASLSLAADRPATLSLSAPLWRQGSPETVSVTVSEPPDCRPVPSEEALTAASAERQLSRTGGTPYSLPAGACSVAAASGLTLPPSRLNALRRAGLEALTAARLSRIPDPAAGYTPLPEAALCPDAGAPSDPPSAPLYTAWFASPAQIVPAAADLFEVCFLPLEAYAAHQAAAPGARLGVALPPVIFDREAPSVRRALVAALQDGVRDILVGNPGHWALVGSALQDAVLEADTSIRLHGELRLNITNRAAAAAHRALCREATGRLPASLLLSPELTLPRLRDLCSDSDLSVTVYGRIPLMLLEKCVIRELYPGSEEPGRPDGSAGEACAACRRGEALLRDRTGAAFPVLSCSGHRNLVFNSLPVSMSDRGALLSQNGILRRHCIFSVESPRDVERVIAALCAGRPVGGEVRRIK